MPTSSLESLAEYRATAIPWTDVLPNHWHEVRCRAIFKIQKRIIGHEGPDVFSITQQGIRVKDVSENDGQLAQDYSKYQIVEPGDFAMNHMDLLTGFIDIATAFGVTSPDYRVFSAKRKSSLFDRFYMYLFQHLYRFKVLYGCGQGASQLGRWRLATDQFYSLLLPLPPYSEQRALTEFLDRETAKIDLIKQKQERLIELLGEKRQAVISHAVTKGLDPSVPMKDSGVEWLGQIPARWKASRLKMLTKAPLTYGANEAAEFSDPECPRFVRITDIDASRNLRDETFRSLPYSVAQPYLLSAGDVLLARSGGTVGKSFIYDKSWGVCCFAGYLIRARLDLFKMSPEFFSLYCQTSQYWDYIFSSQIQSTIQNVSAEKYGNLNVPVPPPDEQVAILTYLGVCLAQIDALVAKAQESIELMKERRSALISAAVTGKIDLRGAP